MRPHYGFAANSFSAGAEEASIVVTLRRSAALPRLRGSLDADPAPMDVRSMNLAPTEGVVNPGEQGDSQVADTSTLRQPAVKKPSSDFSVAQWPESVQGTRLRIRTSPAFSRIFVTAPERVRMAQ
jgi:hypothetical protein